MRSIARLATVALLALSAGACGSPGESDPPADSVPVLGVKVTPQSFVFEEIGEFTQILATISPANATDRAILWESTDSAVASVDSVGLVTAKAVGSGVFITAITHDGHRQASVNVSVNLAPDPPADTVRVLGVKVTPQSVVLQTIGETRQLIATIAPANATDQAIAWESTDSSVVSVNSAGLVTAKAVGSGIFITAFTHDGHHQASANVSVNP
jgi:alpha-amylase